MSIGKKIEKHRKERNLTQQQLGSVIGVSAKTVSKWENDVTFPNASYIILLARALHTSTDELLCFRDRRNELELMWQEAFKKYDDEPQRTLQICMDALEEYPFDTTFLYRAATNAQQLADLGTDDVAKREYLFKAMRYAQRILKEEPNEEAAKEMVVSIYSKLGMEDMAIEQAYKCANVDVALKFCLKGRSLHRHRQHIIAKKLYDLLLEMSYQDLYMLDVREKILNIVIPDGNYQYFYHILEGVYFKRASIYIQRGDEKAAINSLQKLFKIAKSTEDISKNQKRFTAPLFYLLEDSAAYCGPGYVESFLFFLQRDFASLKNNQEFAQILDDASIYVAELSKSVGSETKG